MSAEEARHGLIHAAHRVPHRCIPRQTSPRGLDGITGDVRHRWQLPGNGWQRPRAHPLAQRGRGQAEGPHVGVAPIEVLEPTVSPRLRNDAAIKRGGGVRIYTYNPLWYTCRNITADKGAAICRVPKTNQRAHVGHRPPTSFRIEVQGARDFVFRVALRGARNFVFFVYPGGVNRFHAAAFVFF